MAIFLGLVQFRRGPTADRVITTFDDGEPVFDSDNNLINLNTPYSELSINGPYNHIAVTREAGTIRLFINGIIKDTEPMIMAIAQTILLNLFPYT